MKLSPTCQLLYADQKALVKDRKNASRRLRKALPLNLPTDYPWKVLDKLRLDLEEYLDSQDADELKVAVRNRDFDAYSALAEDWGLQSMTHSDAPVVEIRSKYLLASLIKKFRFPTDVEAREAKAREIFYAAETDCALYNQQGWQELTDVESGFSVSVLRYARSFLVNLLGAELPGSKELLSRSRHGPGATIGTKKGNISLFHKYNEWPYSCTIGAYRYARFAIETDQRWFGALQNSYRSRFGIPKHYPLDMDAFWAKVINVVDGNRIAFVPKDARKERTIAIEPTLNLYLQLGVDGFIRRRLKRFGVDLDSQMKNQELARKGSLPNNSDQFCTIDLSAASDSLSLRLCELLLPRDWYSYLMDLRSPCGNLNGDILDYEKISSMGNGYTFVLESAIFTAIVYAVMKADGVPFDHSKFAVYGDDIIVPKRLYFKTVEALRLCGFRTNLEKTFNSGHIRESCGTDWHQGLPVRPVFLQDTPTDVMGLLCDYNRIKRLLSLRFGLEESKCLTMLYKWIPEVIKKDYRGPYSDEDFDSYIHTRVPPIGSYKEWVYKHARIIVVPRPRKGKDFHMRKLMHDLRGQSLPPAIWASNAPLAKWIDGGGSRFTVTSRNALSVGMTYSVSDVWRSTYADPGPALEY